MTKSNNKLWKLGVTFHKSCRYLPWLGEAWLVFFHNKIKQFLTFSKSLFNIQSALSYNNDFLICFSSPTMLVKSCQGKKKGGGSANKLNKHVSERRNDCNIECI